MSYTVEACEASVLVCCKAKSVPSVVSRVHRESCVCVVWLWVWLAEMWVWLAVMHRLKIWHMHVWLQVHP